jgi:hypothetical protein
MGEDSFPLTGRIITGTGTTSCGLETMMGFITSYIHKVLILKELMEKNACRKICTRPGSLNFWHGSTLPYPITLQFWHVHNEKFQKCTH